MVYRQSPCPKENWATNITAMTDLLESCYLRYLRDTLHNGIWYVMMRMDHQLELFTSQQK